MRKPERGTAALAGGVGIEELSMNIVFVAIRSRASPSWTIDTVTVVLKLNPTGSSSIRNGSASSPQMAFCGLKRMLRY